MLAQLVCVDRRYQRMNCFNIRELQGILKRRFFTDLVNSNDHHNLLSKSMISLRFKTNNDNVVNNDILMFYNYGLTINSKNKQTSLVSIYNNDSGSLFNTSQFTPSLKSPLLLDKVNLISCYFSLQSITHIISTGINSLINLSPLSLVSQGLSSSLILVNLKNLIFLNINEVRFLFSHGSIITFDKKSSDNCVDYASDNIVSSGTLLNYLTTELSTNVRYTRFSNPLISYDYKSGHYLGI